VKRSHARRRLGHAARSTSGRASICEHLWATIDPWKTLQVVSVRDDDADQAGPGRYGRGPEQTLTRDNQTVIRWFLSSIVGLLRQPDPSPEEVAALHEAQAGRQRAEDEWLADEARQARQWSGTGPGI
jgi:hypothetical protein